MIRAHKKKKMCISLNPAICLLGMYSKEKIANKLKKEINNCKYT